MTTHQLPADITDYSLNQKMSFVPNQEHLAHQLWTGGRGQTRVLEIETRLIDWDAAGYWCRQEIRFKINSLPRVRNEKKNDYMKWLRHVVTEKIVQVIGQFGLLDDLIRPETTRSYHELNVTLYWCPKSLTLDNYSDLIRLITQEIKEIIFNLTVANLDEVEINTVPIEAFFIKRALDQAQGNRKIAAHALNISFHTLISKMHTFDITP